MVAQSRAEIFPPHARYSDHFLRCVAMDAGGVYPAPSLLLYPGNGGGAGVHVDRVGNLEKGERVCRESSRSSGRPHPVSAREP